MHKKIDKKVHIIIHKYICSIMFKITKIDYDDDPLRTLVR